MRARRLIRPGTSGPIYALGVKPAYEYVRGIQMNEKVDYPSQYQREL